MRRIGVFEKESKNDVVRESRAKNEGMKLAADNNRAILLTFKNIAYNIAKASADGTASIDLVRAEADRLGIKYQSGNWMGSVFKDKAWTDTGTRVKVTHKGGHCREVRVWKLTN